ncbi:MAG: anti-sigma factor [Ginsengibacter sp.]
MELKDIISSGVLEMYSLGLTSEDENMQVYEWIKQFPEVKSEINEIQNAIEKYALESAIQPHESVKQKILNKIADTASENTSVSNTSLFKKDNKGVVYNMPVYFRWIVAASVILFLGSLAFNYIYYNRFHSASADLQITRNELDNQKEIVAAMSKDMNVVTDKYALPVVLNGTPHAPNALAKIFWMKNTGEVYVDPTNLPQPATGKQYQLWAIVDGKPVDAGMISTQKGIYKIQKMKSFGKAEAFAITLEKEGGSPAPTMDEMYVMAKI